MSQYPNLDIHYALVMGGKKMKKKEWIEQFNKENLNYNLYEYIITCVYYNLIYGKNIIPFHSNKVFNFLLQNTYNLINHYEKKKEIKSEYIEEFNKFNINHVLNTEITNPSRRFLSNCVHIINDKNLNKIFDILKNECEKNYNIYNISINFPSMYKSVRKN